MCEYKLGTAPVPCAMGGPIASGSHHLIICSKFLAFFVTSALLGSMIRCVCIMVGIVSKFLHLECSSCCSMLPKVSTRLICSSMSVFCGSKDKLFHNYNCSLFFPMVIAKNMFFKVVRSLKSVLCCWNHINAFLSSVCSNNSVASFLYL